MAEKTVNFEDFIKSLNNPVYSDLAHLREDDRIDLIGQFVTSTGNNASVLVDDLDGTPERYIRKMLRKFPHLRIAERFRRSRRRMRDSESRYRQAKFSQLNAEWDCHRRQCGGTKASTD